MLIKLVLENFKSFKNRTEIDFRKTNYTILPQNVADNGVLKGAVFVGANASGKSNILKALELLLALLYADKINLNEYPTLFTDKGEFSIEYHFLINSKVFKYTISYDVKKKVFTEHLFYDDEVLLERKGTSATTFLPEKKNYNKDDVSETTLFLRTLYFNTKFTSHTDLQLLMDFLENSIFVDQISRALSTRKREDVLLTSYLDSNGCSKINSFFKKYNINQSIDYVDSNMTFGGEIIANNAKMLLFKRDGINFKTPFEYESTGNKHLLAILPMFFRAISIPCMLIIDEFSSAFHNELEELLMKFFMNNAENSQLFVVTHSTNLLSNSILRPDQEFAVEFGEEGSTIKRFSSEQPRAAQNIEKMYESGVFGGLPNYTNVSSGAKIDEAQ